MTMLSVLAWSGLALLFGRQVAQTLANRARWPWVPQNMFAHDLRDPVRRVAVALRDSDGGQQWVEPGRVLPVEFFRAQRILLEVFGTPREEGLQLRFAQDLLNRLNRGPWRAWDEIDAAARPPDGASFVGFALVLCEYRFAELESLNERPKPTAAHVFFSCGEQAVPGRSEVAS